MTLQLTCKPARNGNSLLFTYQVHNPGQFDAYVMDAMAVAGADGQPGADQNAAVVMLGAGGMAIVGKFMAPLPADRRMAMKAVHLARRVAPGGTLESGLRVPLPLAETSPYYGDLFLRYYEPAEIMATCFALGYWVGGAAGGGAVAYGTDYFRLGLPDGAVGVRHVWQRFPTNGLQLLKRTDVFARPAPGWPAAVTDVVTSAAAA